MLSRYLRSSVAKNAASLYVIHFANYLLPLITVPYVVRVLTPHGYGLVAFGQSFLGYFLVLVEYGFGLSATRKISVSRDDPEAVSRIAFCVWGAKLLLCLAGLLILLLCILLIPTLRENQALLLILYLTALGNALFPGWLYQGMERMVYISIINLGIRLVLVVGIFTLIKKPEDYLLYAGLSSFGALLAGIVGAAWALQLFSLKLVVPSPGEIWQYLKEGWVLFLSTASISLYTVGNSFILGMFTNPIVVGYYSAGEKIVRSLLGLIGPLSQAAYPRFAMLAAESKSQALLWGRRMLFVNGGIGLFLSASLLVAAPLVVNILLGKDYGPSVQVIRVLAFIPFLVAISNVLGIQTMLPFGKDKLFTSILFGAGLVNLSLAFFLISFWQEVGMAAAFLVSEIFVTMVMFFALSFYNLNPFFRRLPITS